MKRRRVKAGIIKNPLFWSLAAGTAFAATYALRCPGMYRDVSGRYAPMARAFCQGDWSMAFDKDFSPLTPVLGGAIASVTGLDPYAGLLAAGGLLYVLAIIPLYYILKTVLGDSNQAGWGCLLYAVAPKIIRIGCTGLLESGRNFMLLSALALIFSFFKERRLWKLALLGFSMTGLCLARSECTAYLPFLAALFLLMHWRSKGYARSLEALRGLTVPVIVSLGAFLLGALPRLMQVSAVCGFPAMDRKQADFARHLLGLPGYEDISTLDLTIDAGQRVHGLFSLERIFDWVGCLVNGAYPVYLAMAVIGIVLLARSRKISFEGWALIATAIFNALLFLMINLSPRYFNVTVPLLMPFTVYLAFEVYNRMPLRYRTAFLCAMALVAAAQVWNGMEQAFSSDGREERKIGLWLKAEGSALLSPSRTPGVLRVASSDTAVNYWSESAHIHVDKNADAVDSKLLAADFVVIEKKRKRIVQALAADSRFKALDRPEARKLAIFTRVCPTP